MRHDHCHRPSSSPWLRLVIPNYKITVMRVISSAIRLMSELRMIQGLAQSEWVYYAILNISYLNIPQLHSHSQAYFILFWAGSTTEAHKTLFSP